VSHHQHNDFADGSQISHELRHHQYGQARHELMNELNHHPREFQHLLHQISNDLMAHHSHPLSVERDRHNNITHINFNHQNLYSGHGQGAEFPNHERHPRQHHHPHDEEATGDTARRPIHGHSRRSRAEQGEESFAPPARNGREGQARPQEELKPGEVHNPFVDLAKGVEKGLDRAGQAIGDAAREIGSGLEHISREVGDQMARLATSVAARLGTVGDCAHGPRLVFDKMGYHLPPMMATEQGRHVRDSGLFDEVSPRDVRPGDYGVRNWNRHVIRQHGYNAGDSFIVRSAHNGNIVQANDHIQNIDRSGRYSDVHFYRPNARFIAMMQEKGLV
jgi:hypothetical protein